MASSIPILSLCCFVLLRSARLCVATESVDLGNSGSLLQSAVYNGQGPTNPDNKEKLRLAQQANVDSSPSSNQCEEIRASVDKGNMGEMEGLASSPTVAAQKTALPKVEPVAARNFAPVVTSVSGDSGGGLTATTRCALLCGLAITYVGVLAILRVLRKPAGTECTDDPWQDMVAKRIREPAAAVDELVGDEHSYGTVESTDDWGCTALHHAAAKGDIKVAMDLLSSGANVDAREAWEETPLHMAAKSGNVETCALLIDHGADVDAKNSDDVTTLLLAGWAGHKAVVKLLLEKGATAGGALDEALPPVLFAAIAENIGSATE